MKALPCEHCTGGRQYAFLTYRVALLPSRAPYTLLSWPPTCVRELLYKCAGCLKKTTITPNMFNMLPTLTLTQLEEMGLAELVTKDLAGAGVTVEQVAQLEAARVSITEMVANR